MKPSKDTFRRMIHRTMVVLFIGATVVRAQDMDTDARDAAIQKNPNAFTKMEFQCIPGTNKPVPFVVKLNGDSSMTYNGRRYSGFRFVVRRPDDDVKKNHDLVWYYYIQKQAGFLEWWITKSEGKSKGFLGYRRTLDKKIGGRVVIQSLKGGELVEGEEYIIWFSWDEKDKKEHDMIAAVGYIENGHQKFGASQEGWELLGLAGYGAPSQEEVSAIRANMNKFPQIGFEPDKSKPSDRNAPFKIRINNREAMVYKGLRYSGFRFTVKRPEGDRKGDHDLVWCFHLPDASRLARWHITKADGTIDSFNDITYSFHQDKGKILAIQAYPAEKLVDGQECVIWFSFPETYPYEEESQACVGYALDADGADPVSLASLKMLPLLD